MSGPRPKPAAVRFAAKVDRTDGCWIWTGAKQAGGYGRFMLSSRPTVLVLAHRFAFEQAHGAIADGLTLDHLCRNTSCVNPGHLEPVSREENALRGSRNAGKTHCDAGHEFTVANTYVSPSRPNVRCCRACRKATSAARHATRKAVA